MSKETFAATSTAPAAAAGPLPALSPSRVEDAVARARAGLLEVQHPDGHWCFEFEADCTIPAEYIMMMHYMDEIDADLEAKIANYLRRKQNRSDGGWPLYYGAEMEISCSIKSYFALKLAGDDPDAPHMKRAREAILAKGGVVNANVFTHIALALFGEVPWRGVPFIPVEIMLLPRWFFFQLSKVSYWSRTVMVPLFILCTLKPRARNPRGVSIRELFTVPPEEETRWFKSRSFLNRVFLLLDRFGRGIEPLIPKGMRARAMRRAEAWFTARLNGEGGLGAIFPAMVNAYEAMDVLGYDPDHPYCVTAREALRQLLVIKEDEAYCQPCVSPVWDTAFGCMALQEEAGGDTPEPARRGLEWLAERQLTDAPGDWQVNHPDLPGGGWPFQYRNDYYPDLDDTALVAWSMHRTGDSRFDEPIRRATDWLAGMQSKNGGFAAFDSDNDHYSLNEIPFADHGALLDPPTSDVSARVLALLGRLGRPQDEPVKRRLVGFLKNEQEADGSWYGRWGTNYVYGTWSTLIACEQAGISPDEPWVRKAIDWLKRMQRDDGGWGEDNGTYEVPPHGHRGYASTPFHTAWAMLGLMAVGEGDSPEVHRGADYLIRTQSEEDGLWHTPWYSAPGFPRVFYLKYHGYDAYFGFWALARYRNQLREARS